MDNLPVKNIFRRDSYVSAFKRFRQPGAKAMRKYLFEFERMIDVQAGPANALDLGCGAGHFALPLAKVMRVKHGYLDALDRSKEMLEVLERQCKRKGILNINLVHADFLDFTPMNSYALVWVSDMLHLVRDLDSFISKIATVLQHEGFLSIRMASHDQLRKYEWGAFFPLALAYDLERHHDVLSVISNLNTHGFTSISVQEVDESRWVSSAKYLSFFESKYLSSLHLLSEDVFQESFSRMKRELSTLERVMRNGQTTLITARLDRAL